MDVVALRYAVEVSGADALYLTNLDVLDGMPSLRAGTGYRIAGSVQRDFPHGLTGFDELSVDYVDLNPWTADTSKCASYDELPLEARAYVEWLEAEVGVPIPLISVGPEREQILRRSHG